MNTYEKTKAIQDLWKQEQHNQREYRRANALMSYLREGEPDVVLEAVIRNHLTQWFRDRTELEASRLIGERNQAGQFRNTIHDYERECHMALSRWINLVNEETKRREKHFKENGVLEVLQ